MKHILDSIILLFLLLLTGCEKEIIAESEQTPDNGKDTTAAITISQEDKALTIAEAQQVDNGIPVLVKGYIVAATTRSMSNADFKEPFEASTAIVLADEPVDLDHFQYEDNDLLLPVCLTDRSKARAALNLADNPQNWNHLVYIYGLRERYMGLPGLKKVDSWEIK